MDEALQYVYKVQKEIALLSGVSELLFWDEKTHMPLEAVPGRYEQLRLIEGIIHERLTSSRMQGALKMLGEVPLSSKDQLMVRVLRKRVVRRSRIPNRFVQELAQERIIAESRWKLARHKNDFEIFRPQLSKIISLKQRQAEYIRPRGSRENRYDTLLDDFEEGMTSERLSEVFAYIRKELTSLLQKIQATSAYKSQRRLRLYLGKEKQKRMMARLLLRMGLPKSRVAVDVSLHPFSTLISMYDVRITSRYTNSIDNFFDIMHEAGHALYDLGLPKKYYNTVLYDAASYGIHESQSTFWENQVARSRDFWRGYFGTYRRYLGVQGVHGMHGLQGGRMEGEDFYRLVNQVRASAVRLTADEVTYCLHIIVRFEIEKDLINSAFSPKYARDVWNARMRDVLGIQPSNDNEGILQDIHWADGDFGYFPTYALGLIYACQIFRQLSREIPGTPELVRKQRFMPIAAWLRKKIHAQGKTMHPEELIREVCGTGLDPSAYVHYLNEKYSRIYGFS